jgi:hypothetical protein
VGGIIIVGAPERACTCIVATNRENRPLGLVCSWAATGSASASGKPSLAPDSSGVVSSTVLYEQHFVSAVTAFALYQ